MEILTLFFDLPSLSSQMKVTLLPNVAHMLKLLLVFHFINGVMPTEGARAALSLSGTMLGYYPLRVLPSKTAIAPVNPTFLPRVMFFCS